MALLSRITRLFHADMHALLDQVEEPEMILNQAIREMQDTLAQLEREIKSDDFKLSQLTKKEDQAKLLLAELDDQLQLCFKAEKDELAKAIVKRKLESKQYLKALSGKISTSSENINGLKLQLKEQRSQLDSMLQKATIFTQGLSPESTNANRDNQSFSIRDEDIEVAFLHEKQQWSKS